MLYHLTSIVCVVDFIAGKLCKEESVYIGRVKRSMLLQLQFTVISAVCCLLSTCLAVDSKCTHQFAFDYCLVD